jgi:hypothetical protein
MAKFTNLTMTENGLTLQIKAQSGTQLKFTKVAIGDGTLDEGESLNGLIQLKKERMSTAIGNLSIENGSTVIKANFSNKDLTESFYLRELGIFANDPDAGEILYAVTYDEKQGDYLPAYNGSEVVEQVFTLSLIVCSATDVTATFAESIYVLRAGETMTGPLVLSGDPTTDLGAATKHYVDNCTVDNIQGFIKSLIVASGKTITTGDVVRMINGGIEKAVNQQMGPPVIFENNKIGEITACVLDSKRVLLAYRNENNSGYGTAIVLSISGTTITTGTAVVFNSGSTDFIRTCVLDSGRVLVVYENLNNSSYGTAVILTISGTIITVGTATVIINTTYTYIHSICMLNSERVLVVYSIGNSPYYGAAVILTVSNTTLTTGSVTVFNNKFTSSISACVLDSSRVLVAYEDVDDSHYSKAVILTVSGTTITVGTTIVFNNAYTSGISACTLDNGRVLVAYEDVNNSYYGKAVILTVSGIAITVGTAIVFNNAKTYSISTCALDNGRVLVAYGSQDSFGAMVILTTSGANIFSNVPKIFANARIYLISAYIFSNNRVLLTWALYAGNNILWGYDYKCGTAAIIDMAPSMSGICGIANESKTNGELCKVSIGPIITRLSGLITGATYYLNETGSLITTSSSLQIGVALSDTELIWQPARVNQDI